MTLELPVNLQAESKNFFYSTEFEVPVDLQADSKNFLYSTENQGAKKQLSFEPLRHFSLNGKVNKLVYSPFDYNLVAVQSREEVLIFDFK